MKGEHEFSVGDWVQKTDSTIGKLTPLFKPMYTDSTFSRSQIQTLSWLSTACLRSTGSALMLLEHERSWDAEVVLRSCFEATLKFVYILAERSNFETRIAEYHDDMSKISSLKDHNRAEQVLDVVSDAHDKQWRPIRDLLLDESVADEIRNRFPKKIRKQIEYKWGFNSLISELVASGDKRWDQLGSLLHVYRNASHVLHADFQGVAMVMEREYRDDKPRILIYRAHTARILTDIIMLTLLRLATAYRFLGISIAPVLAVSGETDALLVEFRESEEHWKSFEYPPEK